MKPLHDIIILAGHLPGTTSFIGAYTTLISIITHTLNQKEMIVG